MTFDESVRLWQVIVAGVVGSGAIGAAIFFGIYAKRNAAMKIKLDLYDRRYTLYRKLNIIFEIGKNLDKYHPHHVVVTIDNYLRDANSVKFLMPKDTMHYFDGMLLEHLTKLKSLAELKNSYEGKTIPETEKKDIETKEPLLRNWFSSQLGWIDGYFKPLLDFSKVL